MLETLTLICVVFIALGAIGLVVSGMIKRKQERVRQQKQHEEDCDWDK